jgi:hypothetical protein
MHSQIRLKSKHLFALNSNERQRIPARCRSAVLYFGRAEYLSVLRIGMSTGYENHFHIYLVSPAALAVGTRKLETSNLVGNPMPFFDATPIEMYAQVQVSPPNLSRSKPVVPIPGSWITKPYVGEAQLLRLNPLDAHQKTL